jgi:hypothetical protein
MMIKMIKGRRKPDQQVIRSRVAQRLGGVATSGIFVVVEK